MEEIYEGNGTPSQTKHPRENTNRASEFLRRKVPTGARTNVYIDLIVTTQKPQRV